MGEVRICEWCGEKIDVGLRRRFHPICIKRKYNYNNKHKTREYYKKNKEKIYNLQKIYNNENKEMIKKHKLKSARKNHEKKKESAREYYKNNKEKHRIYQAKRRKFGKTKDRARWLAYNGKPIQEHCGICNSRKNLERHHWNYDKPLLVSIMCRTCHRIQHVKNYKKSIYGGLTC